MTRIRFLKQNPPIDAVHIKIFESAYKIKLPTDYIQFLLDTNGGEVDYSHFIRYTDSNTGETTHIVNNIYGIVDVDEDAYGLSLGRVNDVYLHDFVQESFQLPTNHLVVAGLEGGHEEVLMSLDESDYGSLYVWNYSIPDELHWLAENFTDFLEKFEWEEIVEKAEIESYFDDFLPNLKSQLGKPVNVHPGLKQGDFKRVIDSGNFQLIMIIWRYKSAHITITNIEKNEIVFDKVIQFEKLKELDVYLTTFLEFATK